MKKKQLDLQQVMIDILYKFCEEEKLEYDSVIESMMTRTDIYNQSEAEIFSDQQENFIERYMNIDERMNDHIYFSDQYRVIDKEERIEKLTA